MTDHTPDSGHGPGMAERRRRHPDTPADLAITADHLAGALRLTLAALYEATPGEDRTSRLPVDAYNEVVGALNIVEDAMVQLADRIDALSQPGGTFRAAARKAG